ncbi:MULTISPECIES: hypothetical protein [unclassified Amycolatopsis]|uniref:hypothetical protein n=1 Tax=unclassified Amycolatopsis TaxID=2618356 RepID=UPI0037BED9E9
MWPDTGVPANARGWLFRVARNRALDVVRRERTLRAKLPLLTEDAPEADDGEPAFLCCHPALPRASQVVLTLKIVGGLGVREIAMASSASPARRSKCRTRPNRGSTVCSTCSTCYSARAAGRDRRAGAAGRRTARAPAAARRARSVVPAGRRRHRGRAPLPARAGLAGFTATTGVPGTAAGRVRVTPGWLVA